MSQGCKFAAWRRQRRQGKPWTGEWKSDVLHHLTRLEFTALKSCFGPRAHLPDHRMMMIRSMPEIFFQWILQMLPKRHVSRLQICSVAATASPREALKWRVEKWYIYIYIHIHIHVHMWHMCLYVVMIDMWFKFMLMHGVLYWTWSSATCISKATSPLGLSLPTHLLRRPLFPGSSESDQFRDRKLLGWMGTDAVYPSGYRESVTSGWAEMGSKAMGPSKTRVPRVPGCHVSWPIPECRMSSKCSKCLKQTCEKIGWCSNLPGLYHLVSLCPNAAIIRYIFSTFQMVTCFLVNADLEG